MTDDAPADRPPIAALFGPGPGLRVLERIFDVALLLCIVVNAVLIVRRPLAYMPDDALFYDQIAVNITHGLGITFSGQMPTNGFHPLWLLICVALAWFAPAKAGLLTLVGAAVVALNLSTLVTLRLVLRRARVPYPSAVSLVGAPYLFFVTIGMEGHLAALLLALTVRGCLSLEDRPTRARLFILAGLGGLLVLSRLDAAILVAPLAGWVVWRGLQRIRPRGRALGELVAAGLLGAAPIALFLALNYHAFGDIRPVSGALKQISAAYEPLNGVAVLYFAMTTAGGLLGLIFVRRAFGAVLAALAAGALLFLAYIVLFTSQAGAWYYYPIAVTAILSAAGGVQLVQDRVGSAHAPALLASGLAVLGLGLMIRYGARTGPDFADFQRPSSLGPAAQRAGIRRVFTFDRPGELAFLDNLSVLAADGLTTNLRFQRALDRNGLDWGLRRTGVQAVVVPRLGGAYPSTMCGARYLNALVFQCDAQRPARVFKIEVFSRLSGRSLGFIDLEGLTRLGFSPDRDLDLVILPPGSEGR
jgi:hypothetical protein